MAKTLVILVLTTLLNQVFGQTPFNPDESQYGYTFYGCLRRSDQTILDYNSTLTYFQWTSTACAQNAVAQGATQYYAVAADFGCWYGNVLGQYSQARDPALCVKACPGNATEACGYTTNLYSVYKLTQRITNQTAASQAAAAVSSSKSAFYASKSQSLSAWGSSKSAAVTSRSIVRSSLSAYKASVSASRSQSYSVLYSLQAGASASHSSARSLVSANKLSSQVSRKSADFAHYSSLVAAGQAKTASEQSVRASVLGGISSSIAAASVSRAAANSYLSASRAAASLSRSSANYNKYSSRQSYYSARSGFSSAAVASKSAYLSSLSAFRASVSASKSSHSSSLSAYQASVSQSYSLASSSKSVAQANRPTAAPTQPTSSMSTTSTSVNPYATYPMLVANYNPAVFNPTWNVCPGNDTLVIADTKVQVFEYHLFCDANVAGTPIGFYPGYSASNVANFLDCLSMCGWWNLNTGHIYCEAASYVMSSNTCTLMTDITKQTNNPAGRGHQYPYYALSTTVGQCLNTPMYPRPTQTKPTVNDT